MADEIMRMYPKLLADKSHYVRLVEDYNRLVNGLATLGLDVVMTTDPDSTEDSWSYRWDGDERVFGFDTPEEAFAAGLKERL